MVSHGIPEAETAAGPGIVRALDAYRRALIHLTPCRAGGPERLEMIDLFPPREGAESPPVRSARPWADGPLYADLLYRPAGEWR